MAVNLNAVSLWNTGSITPTAPLIEGGVAATLAANQGGFGPYYNFGSSKTGRYGMRVTYPSALDFSGYEWATLTAYVTIYGPGDNLDTVANGGLRIYFVDSAGNYAGYNLYGQIPDYHASRSREGFLVSYGTVNNVFAISTARTPDIVSGSLNWSSIKHVEVTSKTIAASQKDFGLSRICKRSAPSITGTEKLASIGDAVRNATSSLLDPLLVQVTPYYFQAAAQSNVTLRIGLTIGNGSTSTNLTDADFSIGFENPYEFSPTYRSVGPWVQLGDARVRALKIIQSPTDVLSLTDGSIASAGWWQWELSGSGTATCTRVQFWRFNGFRSAHGAYVDCEWNGAPAPVEVTAATVITGGRIRGATATGLKITGPAKAYTDISTILNNPSATYDIELGAGGAGTYELPGITVPEGYTLRLRNNSASNAVTIKLSAGVASSTSTVGGAISVTYQASPISIAGCVSGSIAKFSRADTGAILHSAVTVGGVATYAENEYLGAVNIEVRKASTAPYYVPYVTQITPSPGKSTGATALQQLDE